MGMSWSMRLHLLPSLPMDPPLPDGSSLSVPILSGTDVPLQNSHAETLPPKDGARRWGLCRCFGRFRKEKPHEWASCPYERAPRAISSVTVQEKGPVCTPEEAPTCAHP